MVWIGGPRRDPGDRLGRGRRGLYLHDPPPGYRPAAPRMSFKQQQRTMRRDWVLEHILVVILLPSVVGIAVIIVLMVAGYS